VLCADAITGDFKWGIDLVRDFGASVPQWYTGQNPLIDNGRAILAPGGEALLIAADLPTGKIVWRTSNPDGWQMTHSSVVPVVLDGEKLYLYCSTGGLVGVWAYDGSVAFTLPEWKVRMATVPSPLPLPGNRVLLTGGYGAGAMMIQLAHEGRKVKPTILYRLPPEVFGAEQHTPIFYNGFVYGILPVSSQLACLSLDGKQLWASGGKAKFGLGPFLIADGMLLMLSDTGTLNLVEPTPDAFKPVAQARIFDHAHEAWGPMAMSGGRLFARDLTRLACFDLREAAHD
jgi:outer membrane protein assembly factor BamB